MTNSVHTVKSIKAKPKLKFPDPDDSDSQTSTNELEDGEWPDVSFAFNYFFILIIGFVHRAYGGSDL